MTNPNLAEKIGAFREILGNIAVGGPRGTSAADYSASRQELLSEDRVAGLLPEFIVESRTARDFWNYVQRAFGSYADRSRYIEAQLLPVERQLRAERQKAPGIRPPEVRFEFSPVRPPLLGVHRFVSEDRIAELRALTPAAF